MVLGSRCCVWVELCFSVSLLLTFPSLLLINNEGLWMTPGQRRGHTAMETGFILTCVSLRALKRRERHRFIQPLSQYLLSVILQSTRLQTFLQVNLCATCLSLYSHNTLVFLPAMEGPVTQTGDPESLRKRRQHPLLLSIFFAHDTPKWSRAETSE